MAICRRRYAPHCAPLARSIRTPAPLFVNGRSQQKRVISGRLTMPMTRYNRARKMTQTLRKGTGRPPSREATLGDRGWPLGCGAGRSRHGLIGPLSSASMS